MASTTGVGLEDVLAHWAATAGHARSWRQICAAWVKPELPAFRGQFSAAVDAATFVTGQAMVVDGGLPRPSAGAVINNQSPTISHRGINKTVQRSTTKARGAVPMSRVEAMLDAYPKDLGNIYRAKLAECIEACFECAQTCTACADACLSEDMVAELTKCIRTDLDCADICATTGAVLSRHTGYDASITTSLLEACRVACAGCAAECESHASMHEHCRVCGQACRRCESACADLLTALG